MKTLLIFKSYNLNLHKTNEVFYWDAKFNPLNEVYDKPLNKVLWKN